MGAEADVKDKGTAQPGSEPGDKTAQAGAVPAGQEGAKEGATPGAEEKLPFDQHPKWKAARQAEQKLQEIMEANDCESVEDLVTLVASGKVLVGRQLNEEQLDKLMKSAETLERYEAYWKEQEEKDRRSKEDPADTIARLEREKKALQDGQRTKEQQAEHKKQLEEQWANYDRQVLTFIESDPEIPEEYRGIVAYAAGVKNEASSIDFTDKKAIKTAVQKIWKRIKDYEDLVIKRYIDGKTKIPKVPSAAGGSPEQKTPVKNLREARKIMLEQLSRPKA